jgi:hypothetical protein
MTPGFGLAPFNGVRLVCQAFIYPALDRASSAPGPRAADQSFSLFGKAQILRYNEGDVG